MTSSATLGSIIPAANLAIGENKLVQSAWLQVAFAALSGALIGLPFIFSELFLLEWFAWVPLLCACYQNSLRRCYLLGLICGLVCYTISLYWITDFVFLFKGYGPLACLLFSLGFWFYSAQLQALLILAFAALVKFSKLHPVWIFPPLVVIFHALFPALFSVQLGESQSQFVQALQAIEYTGVYGLDWLIALSSIAVYSVVTKNRATIVVAATLVLLITWFAAGAYLQNFWEKQQSQWPTRSIGLVQSNEAPILGKRKVYPGFSLAYPPEMAMTEQLAAAGAELVLWPEAKTKFFFTEEHVSKAFQTSVNRVNVPIVFQDMDPVIDSNGEPLGNYNTAVMLSPQQEEVQTYRKIKRIAVGESLPIVDQLPFLKQLLSSYLGDFYKAIYSGEEHKIFVNDAFTVVPLVCYEVIFSDFTSRAAALAKSGAANPVMVTLSSDAWFGDSHQPRQHVNTSILRAVENRIPLIHVVNNGPSIAVDTVANVVFKAPHNQAGGYRVDIPIAPQYSTTFFNRNPTLVLVIAWMVLATALWHVVRRCRTTRY